jgi:flavin reductase (DIM6/NTAB) family NADH-FMN oxidoreductase RutF
VVERFRRFSHPKHGRFGDKDVTEAFVSAGLQGNGEMSKQPVRLTQFNRVIHPMPAFLITCAGLDGRPNAIAIAWLTPVSFKPPLLAFSIRPERYSYELLRQNPAFVVNVMTFEWATEVNYCGHFSGREVDKFEATGLTPVPAQVVSVPAIAEAAANVECEVDAWYPGGQNTLVVGRVVTALARPGMLAGKWRDLPFAPPLLHVLSNRYTTSTGQFVEPDNRVSRGDRKGSV